MNFIDLFKELAVLLNFLLFICFQFYWFLLSVYYALPSDSIWIHLPFLFFFFFQFPEMGAWTVNLQIFLFSIVRLWCYKFPSKCFFFNSTPQNIICYILIFIQCNVFFLFPYRLLLSLMNYFQVCYLLFKWFRHDVGKDILTWTNYDGWSCECHHLEENSRNNYEIGLHCLLGIQIFQMEFGIPRIK